MSPHAPPLRGSLPPEGADPALGRPGGGIVGPHAPPLREGVDPPGGGPAADRARPQGFEGFEGSYLGNREVLRPGSRLECKICWWVYDPAAGDPQWQVPAGTPFADLPSHWRCPNCDGDAEQFLLLPEEGVA